MTTTLLFLSLACPLFPTLIFLSALEIKRSSERKNLAQGAWCGSTTGTQRCFRCNSEGSECQDITRVSYNSPRQRESCVNSCTARLMRMSEPQRPSCCEYRNCQGPCRRRSGKNLGPTMGSNEGTGPNTPC